MSFLNVPIKSVSVSIISVSETEFLPWNNPLLYPVIPPNLPPPAVQKAFKWRIVFNVDNQLQSSYLTRNPGAFDGQDISVGDWISNLTSGQAWQIVSVESKTSTQVTAIVQDIYRYNTFRDPAQVGIGAPPVGNCVVFELNESGLPQIDPIPASGISSTFATNLTSRFNYINLQYDFPLYQAGNTFAENDVIAASANTNSFVLSDATNKLVIGRVTSVSDTVPGWFTINPVQKIVDFLDYLPGDIADTIYSSTTIPGGITDVPGGSQVYIKLRNNTSSVSNATAAGGTTSGNIFQLNGVDVQVLGAGTANDLLTAANLVSSQTGVTVTLALVPSTVQTNNALVTVVYGEPALWASSSPATASINGITVTFNIVSSDPGYEDYSRPAQMALAINNAAIPNIVASAPSALVLRITNTAGGAITIINLTSDINGVPFGGSNSGSGLLLSTPASVTTRLRFTAIDARAIDFLNVTGNVVGDFGLVSVENGVKACGLYTETGLRTASTVVVADLAALNALTPLIGDQAYVIDSDDGSGNNVGLWSMWLYDGVIWVETGNQDSASTDAKSLEYTLGTLSPGTINIGEISTGRRVTLITVEVTTPFDGPGPATVSIGYQVNNPVPPPAQPAGLMTIGLTDLTVAGTYTTYTDILFGTDTVQGDVTITATFNNGASSAGSAQIIVSYV